MLHQPHRQIGKWALGYHATTLHKEEVIACGGRRAVCSTNSTSRPKLAVELTNYIAQYRGL